MAYPLFGSQQCLLSPGVKFRPSAEWSSSSCQLESSDLPALILYHFTPFLSSCTLLKPSSQTYQENFHLRAILFVSCLLQIFALVLSPQIFPYSYPSSIKLAPGFPGGSVVKNSLAMKETQVRSLHKEDPLETEMETHSSILAWRVPMNRGAWRATAHGVVKSWTQLSN